MTIELRRVPGAPMARASRIRHHLFRVDGPMVERLP